MNVSNPTRRLAELVAQKHAVLTQLRELGQHQARLIEAGELGDLLKLLAVKQGCLQRLQQVERGLDPFRHQDPQARTWESPAERARCAAQADACEVLLGEILRQEKFSELRLEARRDEAAQRLAGAHWAGQARQAYASDPTGSATQLDVSSGD